MSRAFVKETDAADSLLDREISDFPNDVTPEGLLALESAIFAAMAVLAKARTTRECAHSDYGVVSPIIAFGAVPPRDTRSNQWAV